MAYEPIENYGIIGDMHTVALVSTHGSIDWLCFPRFDSPSVFAQLLDDEKGGYFQICPQKQEFTQKQVYWPDTNVLITRFLSPDGVVEVIDYMPVRRGNRQEKPHEIVRQVKGVRGEMPLKVYCQPAFNYARDSHTTSINEYGAAFHSPSLSLGLSSTAAMRKEGSAVISEITIQEGDLHLFSLRQINEDAHCEMVFSNEEANDDFKQTVAFWRNWLSQSTYTGRWREIVHRSALVLKLLTYEPTGAIVAAPTCSLPEEIGGERNWDYRYTWIRDAAFTVYAFMRIGFTEEAFQFMDWVEKRSKELNTDGSLQIMYGIDGRHQLDETTLDHLKGYRNSRPVRCGNAAYDQFQLDIYGELMDSVYLFNKYGTPISYELWTYLRQLVNWVCEHWEYPDEGIWEVRGGKQHFVYSKLMAWVALDRGIRLAWRRSLPADRDRWIATRDRIYEDIMAKGWSDNLQAFKQTYHAETLDAANLLMPLVFFVSPTDPLMLKTIDHTLKSASEGGLMANGLVYRYNQEKTDDGLTGGEGTFNICTFWLVEVLARAGRAEPQRLEEARLYFEKMLGFSNHLGLFAEETGPSGEALGNFPQAFTHLALISSAYNLDRALNNQD
jgi:GH15 family glucan-1,4-alpha-glucosidase